MSITKIKEFYRKNDYKILTVFAFILIAFVSYRAGETHQKNIQSANINVSLNQLAAANPHEEKIKTLGEALERRLPQASAELANPDTTTGQPDNSAQTCVFIGSKNSNKYHLPNCKYASKINQGNRVCFTSAQDAADKGYEPAKCCIK